MAGIAGDCGGYGDGGGWEVNARGRGELDVAENGCWKEEAVEVGGAALKLAGDIERVAVASIEGGVEISGRLSSFLCFFLCLVLTGFEK